MRIKWNVCEALGPWDRNRHVGNTQYTLSILFCCCSGTVVSILWTIDPNEAPELL